MLVSCNIGAYGINNRCKLNNIMSTKRLTTEEFIQRSKELHFDKFTYDQTIYKNANTPIIITCKVHGHFSTNPNNHIHKRSGCPLCYGRVKKNTSQFIDNVKKVHGNIFTFEKTIYTNDTDKLIITCKEHGDFTPRPTNLLQGSGCPSCALDVASRRYRKSQADFIIQSNIIHNDKYDYSSVEYVNNRTNVTIICPTHGSFSQSPSSHIHSKCGCPSCKSSKGEIEVRNWLQNNNIEFSEQHTFSDCRDRLPLRFDFYLPHYNMLIEFNGIQHYRYIPAFHKNNNHDSFERVKQRDIIKSEYCKSNGLQLLIIPYNRKVNDVLTQLFTK